MSDQITSEQMESKKEEGVKVDVPNGFFNMKLVLILVLAWLVLKGIEIYGQFFYGVKDISTNAWIFLGIYFAEILIWFLGLQLWARVKLVGYWWIAIFAHLGFILSIIEAIGASNTQARVINVVKAVLIFVFMLTNIWSREVLKFFKKSNGKCPLCLGSPCGEPKKNKKWTCPACNRTLIWSKVEA